MGDGSASGVGTPPQPGVIVREGENFPPIPQRLLNFSIEELDAERERLSRALSAKRQSVLPNRKAEEGLENVLFVYEAAREAVRRRQEAPVVP
mgnify:CR=1 FL=1